MPSYDVKAAAIALFNYFTGLQTENNKSITKMQSL